LQLLVSTVLLAGHPAEADDRHRRFKHHRGYEVWIIDQSDTTPDGGGTLYIYDGKDLADDPATAEPEVIDLGGAARTQCLDDTGTAPRRPHYLEFNARHSHAIIAFVATGHVLFMDAATREPVTCIDVGVQAHAAIPSPDETYVIVANQGGKLLQRITTNYRTNTFTLDDAATLDLAGCTTPNGVACEDPAVRPDNAPIITLPDATSTLTFVTLRGGGLFVVDSTATPMQIVGEYDAATVHPIGLLVIEAAGKMYTTSGGGPGNPFEADLYAFPVRRFSTTPNPPNTPRPKLVFSHDVRRFVSAHGVVLTGDDRFLWVADQAANRIIVVDTRSNTVVNEFNLFGRVSPNPAPDLLDISPQGHLVFMSLRGPVPLTNNDPGFNNAAGSTPGLGVVEVKHDGRRGVLKAVAPITHVVSGKEAADPHGLRVRHK
jgi:hypothetical protein